jgi:MiaB-like tRNA modifying enzyme
MRVYIEVYGCTMNRGEAALMEELIERSRHHVTREAENADVFTLVTCTVIETTERRMLKRIHHISDLNKPLIVAGCMASAQPDTILKHAPHARILEPKDLNKIVELVDIIEEEAEERYPKCRSHMPVFLIPERSTTAIIPIAQGCQGECTYCITKVARGELKSRPIEEIINDVKKNVSNGCKEILVTTQDTAAYGEDMDKTLVDLIEPITELEGKFKVRIGMANPSSVLPILEKIVDIYQNEKIYKFLHLPVQSGDDEILRKMGRRYTIKEFKYIVERFRDYFPDITLSTDIIVGFPGETDENFKKSCELIEEIKPDIVNITRFSPRPNTKAKAMKEQIPGWIAKNRSRLLTKLRFEISRRINEGCVGNIEEILITEIGKNKSMIGRTNTYKPVVIKKSIPLGEYLKVKITGAANTYLRGQIIEF